MNRYDYAKQWVISAGELLCSMLKDSPVSVTEKKGHSDIVTDFDKKLEQYLRGEIRSKFPEDQIVGEEFPASGEAGTGCTWYIDPIDGTTNFVSQRCNFAICVGCKAPDGADFGFVLDVEGGQLYSAEAGKGAWMNGTRLHTSNIASIPDLLLTYPSATDIFLGKSKHSVDLARLSIDVRAIRSLGSVALELCQVASGRMDLCIAINSSPWDHNAARVILNEAGGAIRALEGTPLPYNTPSAFIAGNSEALVSEIVKNYIKKSVC